MFTPDHDSLKAILAKHGLDDSKFITFIAMLATIAEPLHVTPYEALECTKAIVDYFEENGGFHEDKKKFKLAHSHDDEIAKLREKLNRKES